VVQSKDHTLAERRYNIVVAMKAERDARHTPRSKPRGPRVAAGAPPAEELHRLRHELDMSREDIAKQYGVTLSRVKRWLAYRKIAPRVPAYRSQKRAELSPERLAEIGALHLLDDSGLPLMERAAKRLGSRLGECRVTGRYTLGGRPVRVEDVLKAAGLHLNILPPHHDGSCLGRRDGCMRVRDTVGLGNSALASAGGLVATY
jgi:hypothetical protein